MMSKPKISTEEAARDGELEQALARMSEPQRHPIRESALGQFYCGSGRPVPSSTDQDIAEAIRCELAPTIGNDWFDPPIQVALIAAARAVRKLFPTNIDAVAKDII